MEPFAVIARQRSFPRSLCTAYRSRHIYKLGIRPSRRPPRISKTSSFSTSSLRTAPTTEPRSQNENSTINPDPPQAYPLSGYYSDLLFSPFPRARSARTTKNVRSAPVELPPPTPASTTEAQSPKDKMSIVFGSRLASPGYKSVRYNPSTMPPESTWKTLNRVAIPPRPVEPDNCCMSGCAHCVWDDFRDDLEAWAARLQEAQAKSTSTTYAKKDMRQNPRAEVHSASISMDDDGGGSETNWSMPTAGINDDLFAGIPVGIREFMKTEKRLRDKHRQEKEKGLA